jgi:hypothetical protein
MLPETPEQKYGSSVYTYVVATSIPSLFEKSRWELAFTGFPTTHLGLMPAAGLIKL